jgi:hypothetical protein
VVEERDSSSPPMELSSRAPSAARLAKQKRASPPIPP